MAGEDDTDDAGDAHTGRGLRRTYGAEGARNRPPKLPQMGKVWPLNRSEILCSLDWIAMNGRKIFTQIQPEKHILQAGTGFQGFCKPMNSWGKIATADLQLQLGMLSIS